jgi:hypothetical protein
MLTANDNVSARTLQIAVWKMLRAGVPRQLISSTLGLSEDDLDDLASGAKNNGSFATQNRIKVSE